MIKTINSVDKLEIELKKSTESLMSRMEEDSDRNIKQHSALSRSIVQLKKKIRKHEKQLNAEVECRTANNELIFNKLDCHNLWLWILSGVSLFEFVLIVLLMIIK